ncbi:MAG: actin-binding WH2 domain-containing protein [Calditrichaeota bacterium]|nr:actin-binding WH2 domain-containing protein [Calditrichota bacterium]
MGSNHSVLQALVAGIKLPLLFFLALLICFPAFYIVQYILGSKLNLSQMIIIILSGMVLASAIMISFAPVVIFFLLTGSNYYFLQLLHIAIIILSGIFGMKEIIDALKFSCEQKGIYPRIGVEVFRFWVIIFAFVGIQLAWNLRPFLGDSGKPFKLFRKYEGNFYTAIIYSFQQLAKSEKKDQPEKQSKVRDNLPLDSLWLPRERN